MWESGAGRGQSIRRGRQAPRVSVRIDPMSKLLRTPRREPPTPLYCFAIGRNEHGARVEIPMQPQADGSLVSAPVGERCDVVALSVDGVVLPLRWFL